MIETPLEQCRRHVSQGGQRIARQESLIAQLERAGHERMLLEARVLLTTLKTSQQLGEEHLAREITRKN